VAKRKNRRLKRTPVLAPALPPVKLDPVWGSKRMTVLDGRQVRCLTFDEGSVWIHGLDELPLLVRRRLADAHHNICPTCVNIETRNNGTPSLKLYFAVIEAIERTLDRAEQRYNLVEEVARKRRR
jgi:hypothetical protein